MRQSTRKSPSHNLFFLLIFIFTTQLTIFSQTTPLYPEAELTFQTCNVYNNTKVYYKYESTGSSYVWKFEQCKYMDVPNYSYTIDITGNHNGDIYFIEQIHEYQLPITKGYFGLTKLKITVSSFDKDDKIFYYDVRDCQFYGECDFHTQDITLRYDWLNEILWFKPYKDIDDAYPTVEDDWEKISETTATTKTFWQVKGLSHCPLDFSGVAPSSPSGLSISGNVGDHPVLSWNANTEPDIDGYKIYVDYNNTGYSLLYTVSNPVTTTFTDNGVTITGGRFDPSVCYKISAFDVENLESNYTFPKCTKGTATSKVAVSQDIVEENLKNTIGVYPNPFNPGTRIIYSLREDTFVEVKIFDMLGQEIALLVYKFLPKGKYNIEFNAGNLNSGV